MQRCLTARQRDLLELAGQLADKFAERAAEHDRDNTFPFENYDDMRASGYLNLTVPEELGGAGASLLDLVLAQERLAMGDGSTALAVNMHVSPVGQWASIWRRTRDKGLEELLRGVVAGEVIWASLTSEPGVANMLMDSRTIADRVDGGYRINGHKIFCTNSEVATHCSITARYEDPVTGPRLIIFRTPTDAEEIEFVRTWDTMGMRGTQSNDMKVAGLFLPDEAVVHSLPVDHFDATIVRTVFAWAMPTFGTVYVGMAAGAMEQAKEVVRKKGKGDDPLVQQSFAQMEMLLESARAVLWRHCEDVMSGELFTQMGVQEAQARAGLAKVVACNNAAEIMRHIPDVLGGMSYTRKLPFERMWRDVQAGPIMPYNNHQAARLFGATSLGVPLHPEIDDEESGTESRPKSFHGASGEAVPAAG
jgi:alkylation response protein AidB-like acyl-CoA dehydrogenase